jgi:hypothetical protein
VGPLENQGLSSKKLGPFSFFGDKSCEHSKDITPTDVHATFDN